MTEKGLVAFGPRAEELAGAGWPLRDISEGGLRFAVPVDMPDPPSVGDEISLRIEFPGKAPEGGDAAEGGLPLCAVVRRVVQSAGTPEREICLEFSGLGADDRESLRGTVLDLAVEKVAKGGELLAGAHEKPESEGESKRARLGDILVTRMSISREDLERFIGEDYDAEKPLGRQLVGRGLVGEVDVARALAEQSGLPYVDLDVEGIDLLKVRQFGEAYLTQHLFIPLAIEPEYVALAAAAPLGEEVVSNVARQYGREVRTVVASERQIVSAIQKAFYVSRNRRRSARFATGLSLRFKFYDESWQPLHAQILTGLTKNISEGGMLFVGPIPSDVEVAPLGDRKLHVGVHMFLPNQTEPVRAPCELLRTTVLRPECVPDGTPQCLYAVRVLGVSDDDRKRLNMYRMQASVPRLFMDRYS
jgi:hypothetical protein